MPPKSLNRNLEQCLVTIKPFTTLLHLDEAPRFFATTEFDFDIKKSITENIHQLLRKLMATPSECDFFNAYITTTDHNHFELSDKKILKPNFLKYHLTTGDLHVIMKTHSK